MIVTIARYRIITLDQTNNDAVVSGGLLDAQALVEDYLRRDLESATHTETLRLYPQGGPFSLGRVYPTHTPIVSVSDPADATIEGDSIRDVGPDDGPFLTLDPIHGVRATVTYVGGWSATTLPASIERAVAQLAQAIVGGGTATTPTGVTAASVGDVSVTYATATVGLDELAPGITARLRPWRKRPLR